MKVFVTGASGFIGTAVTADLLKHGHQVLGLARSGASSEKIKKSGATVIEGSLHDLESLKKGARESDAIVHLAYVHDFSSVEAFKKATETDRTAITAMGEAIYGTGKPFAIASGLLGFPQGEVATEDTDYVRAGDFSERARSADLLFKMSKEQNFRGMSIRLPPTVHGEGDQGFITMLGGAAKKNGFATYINQGTTRWSAAHREDVATLIRLALDKGKAAVAYNAAAEEGVPMKDIMTAVGQKLQLPAESKTEEEALPLLGFFAHAINMDNPVSSEKTRKELGWEPIQVGLLEDIKQNYF